MDDSKPFKILGIQQIAIGAESKALLENFFIDLLGLTQIGSFVSESENVRETICTVGEEDSLVELDLMEPIDSDKKPSPHIPALNHIGLWVDNLEAAHDWLQAKGVRITPGGIREGAAGHKVFFTHPRGNKDFPLGSHILLEFVQSPSFP